MFGDRYEIRLTLKNETPLHVGSGEFADIIGADEKVSFACLTRDADDRPYLPATSIKGALRRLAEQHFPNDDGIVPLFGRELKEKDAGVMGRLLVRGGEIKVTESMPDIQRAPFANTVNRKGSFIAARTKIVGEKGVADDHRLFHQEMAAPGLCFDIAMTLVSFGKKEDQDKALALLKKILAVVARDGFTLGRSQADGQGLLKINGPVTMTPYVLNDAGDLAPGARETIKAAAPASEKEIPIEFRARSFTLLCAAPFVIIDSSIKGAGKDVAKEQEIVQLSAQRLAEQQPLVLGSSMSGALRARAHWLWRLSVLRGEMNDVKEDEDDPVEELFGKAGRRACVEIRNLKVSEATAEKITSLKVDRFTGAPVHGALFTTDSFTGTRLSFDLVLVQRGNKPGDDAKVLWNKLLEEIKHRGLELGHGTNKGFGWFNREQTA